MDTKYRIQEVVDVILSFFDSIEMLEEVLDRFEQDVNRGDIVFGGIGDCEKCLVDLLKKLIIKRVAILSAFELVAEFDSEAALDIVMQRYLGKNVDPDTKHGGYESELSCMLSDLAEVNVMLLNKLILMSDFDRSKIDDQRVVNSFVEALGFESDDDLDSWVESVMASNEIDPTIH